MRTLAKAVAGGFGVVLFGMVAGVGISAAEAQAQTDVRDIVRTPSPSPTLKLPFGEPNFFPIAVWMQPA